VSSEEALFEINRTIGRFEARFDAQDKVLAQVQADVAELKARPARRITTVLRWVGTVAATFIAGLLFVVFGIRKP
jgi:hypothetical protein